MHGIARRVSRPVRPVANALLSNGTRTVAETAAARQAFLLLALAVHRARGQTLKNELGSDGLGSSHFSDEDPRVEDASAAGCSGPLPASSARIVKERRTEAGRTVERTASIVNDADPDE